MRILLMLMFLLASPAFAQESILLNVNQTHTLHWDWQSEGSPVRAFVFQCQQYRKDLEADVRSLRFGSLVDEPGRFTGCTLSAKNEVGLSAPVIVPDFDYAYSYKALGMIVLEWCGLIGASAGALAGSMRVVLGWQRRRRERTTPLALPEPMMIMEKEREHVYRHY